MSAIVHAAVITAQLRECRDIARGILGDRYRDKMAELGAIISAAAQQEGDSILGAVTRIGRSGELNALATTFMLAAAAEMLEPSRA